MNPQHNKQYHELIGEALVSHTFLDYINGILMDESLENSYSCSQLLSIQSNRAYQLIFKGFYDILMNDKTSNVHLSSLTSQPHGGYSGHHAADESHIEDGHLSLLGEVVDSHADIDCMYNKAFTRSRKRDGESVISNCIIANEDRHRAMFDGSNIVLEGIAAPNQQSHHQHIANDSFVHSSNECGTHLFTTGSFLHTSDVCESLVCTNGPFVHTSKGCKSHSVRCSYNIVADNHVQKLSFDENCTSTLSLQPVQSLDQIAQEKDVSFVMNADLAAEWHAQLFDEWRGRGKDEGTLLEGGSAQINNKGWEDAALASPIDLKALLLGSAKALGEGDTKKAMEFLHQVRQQGASPHGTGLQRVAHYFSEAMMARMSGMGSTLYAAIASTSQLPAALMTLKAYKMVFEVCPYLKTAHYFANQYILKASHGASRLHIVDYGIFYGFQWPCLIYALAHRMGGSPVLRITGIELPTKPADINPSSTIEGTGRRLAEYAKTYNVPFEYHAVSADNWEDIDPTSLHISPGEVLVLNSFNRLRHLHDESDGDALSPRDRLLQQMRGLNPCLLVTGFMNAYHSSPFFVPRFREALHYYCNKFDTLHTIVYEDSVERRMFEREVMGRAVLNVVACEGIKRVERPEGYRQWQARLQRAGFRPRPLIPSVLSTSKTIMRSYHKDFSLLHDSNTWMLLGWRGRTMQSLSAWEPATPLEN